MWAIINKVLERVCFTFWNGNIHTTADIQYMFELIFYRGCSDLFSENFHAQQHMAPSGIFYVAYIDLRAYILAEIAP